MKKTVRFKDQESGQGTLEYILVLLILVILILSLVYRFHSAFKNYAEAFFGDYVACMLETGELPGTGLQCEFPVFNAKSGKGILKDSLRPSRSSGKANANANAGKKYGGSGGEVVGPNTSRSFVARVGDDGRSKTQVEGPADGSERDSKNASGLSLSNNSGGRMSRSGSQVFIDSGSSGFVDAVQIKAKQSKVAEVSSKNADDGEGLRASKGIEPLEQSKKTKDVNAGVTFTFGKILRLFIMIIIIIAMVVFFGGQLMQIARSRDKGGGD